jgi:hypothetical protein
MVMNIQPRLSRPVILLVVLALAGLFSTCAPAAKKPPKFTEIEGQLQEMAKKRETYQKELAQMNPAQLYEILQKESLAGREPYNSMAYTELVSRGEKASPELQSLLKQPDRSSLLGLLALRDMDQGLYRKLEPSFRIVVLVEALEKSEYFNSWGLPHLYWESAAKALIAEGRAAEDSLKKLLDDERPAPMWGQEEVIEYRTYSYRVRDYAWALILAIRQEKQEIPTEPAKRDELIARMLKE